MNHFKKAFNLQVLGGNKTVRYQVEHLSKNIPKKHNGLEQSFSIKDDFQTHCLKRFKDRL